MKSEFTRSLEYGLENSRSLFELLNHVVTWEHDRISRAIQRGDIHPVAHTTCFKYCMQEAIKAWGEKYPEDVSRVIAIDSALSIQKSLTEEITQRFEERVKESAFLDVSIESLKAGLK